MAVNAISVISGLMTIFSFAKDNFPEPDTAKAKVKIVAGLDNSNGGLTNAGGDFPDVRLWNNYGDFLGMKADPGKVGDGTAKEVSITYNEDKGQQAMYTLFSANNDAICIAWASITWPGGENFAWVGDWGRQCGGSWYYSGVAIEGSGHEPDCFWIDKNGDQPQTGFQVRWPDFVQDNNDEPTGNPDDVCDTYKFKMHTEEDPNTVTYNTNPGNMKNKRAGFNSRAEAAQRSKKRAEEHQRRGNFASRLIVDDLDVHTAQDLCGSDTSVGPDFVNVEDGYFCAMSEGKKVYPICSDGVRSECFNLDIPSLVKGNMTARSEPYDAIIDWRKNKSVDVGDVAKVRF